MLYPNCLTPSYCLIKCVSESSWQCWKSLSQRVGGGGEARLHFCQNSFLLIENKRLNPVVVVILADANKKNLKESLDNPVLITTMELLCFVLF